MSVCSDIRRGEGEEGSGLVLVEMRFMQVLEDLTACLREDNECKRAFGDLTKINLDLEIRVESLGQQRVFAMVGEAMVRLVRN